MFKICVVGCGAMSRSGHGPSFKKYFEDYKDVVLAGCCDIKEEAAIKYKEQFGFEAYYTDYQKLRLHVTPGITCTWQISKNRNDIPFETWVEMDLEYIQNRTFPGDILIMLKTPIVMLSATGR